jgi:RHS repeat-associated protein
VDTSGYGLIYQPITSSSEITWDTNGGLALVLSDGSVDYIYGLGTTPVEQVSLATSTPTYMTYTHADSTWFTTNAAGDETGFWGYDAFGTLAFGAPTSAFGYAGQYTDATTGLSDMRARWYDPGTGQFVSVDPDFAETDQPYVYAGDDPANKTDPSGDMSTTVVAPSFWAGGNPPCKQSEAYEVCHLLFSAGPLELIVPGTTMTPGAEARAPDLYLDIQDLNGYNDSFTVTDEDYGVHEKHEWTEGSKLIIPIARSDGVPQSSIFSLPVIGQKGTSPIWTFTPYVSYQDGYTIRVDAPYSGEDNVQGAPYTRQFLVNFGWQGPSPLSMYNETEQTSYIGSEVGCAGSLA